MGKEQSEDYFMHPKMVKHMEAIVDGFFEGRGGDGWGQSVRTLASAARSGCWGNLARACRAVTSGNVMAWNALEAWVKQRRRGDGRVSRERLIFHEMMDTILDAMTEDEIEEWEKWA